MYKAVNWPIMILNRIFYTDEPDDCNDELAAHDGVEHWLVKDHPRGAVISHGNQYKCILPIES